MSGFFILYKVHKCPKKPLPQRILLSNLASLLLASNENTIVFLKFSKRKSPITDAKMCNIHTKSILEEYCYSEVQANFFKTFRCLTLTLGYTSDSKCLIRNNV